MKIALTFTRLIGLSAIVFSTALVSCGNNATTEESKSTNADSAAGSSTAAATTTRAEAALSGTKADTSVSGSVSFEAVSGNKVKLTLQISVPKKANKSVAVHLHEHPDCGDTGTHAGGHWNPTGANHGKWGEGTFHSGDIGNITLDAKGNGTLTLESDLWSLGGDSKTDILNKTVIVHSGVDDYKSQPAGNSGPRIGCGIIKASEPQTANSTPSEPH